jgi:hypothetical protein
VTIAFQGSTGFQGLFSLVTEFRRLLANRRHRHEAGLHPNPNPIGAATTRTIATMGRPISTSAMDQEPHQPDHRDEMTKRVAACCILREQL